jgi:hypothetical protein
VVAEEHADGGFITDELAVLVVDDSLEG